MNIDIHTHYIPPEFIDLIKKDPVRYQAKIDHDTKGQEIIRHDQGFAYPLYKGIYDIEVRLKDMDKRKIDIDVISVAPTIYYYWAECVFR